jgi:repressor LexA
MRPLTERQNQILEFIRDYISKNLKPPTVREICEEFKFKSTNAVYSILKSLEKKGYIKKVNGKSRNIIPKDIMFKEENDIKEIPLLSKFNSKNPLLMFTNLIGTVKIDAKMFDHPSSFAVIVPDDGMQKAGIFKNDIAIIKQDTKIENGDIVFAVTGNNAFIRYFKSEHGKIYLVPSARGYETLSFNEDDKNLWIGGKVSLIIRKIS